MEESELDEWEAVKDIAHKLFNPWGGATSRMEWVKEAWGHMAKAGLVDTSNFIGETKAQLLIAQLAIIFDQFAHYAWEDGWDYHITSYTGYLQTSDMALGILYGRLEDQEEGYDEDDLRPFMIERLIDSMKLEIFECLSTAYGGAETLYGRMYRSGFNDLEPDDDADAYETTGNNMRAFTFVMQGFN
jgi:hypothetical protein